MPQSINNVAAKQANAEEVKRHIRSQVTRQRAQGGLARLALRSRRKLACFHGNLCNWPLVYARLIHAITDWVLLDPLGTHCVESGIQPTHKRSKPISSGFCIPNAPDVSRMHSGKWSIPLSLRRHDENLGLPFSLAYFLKEYLSHNPNSVVE